MAEGATVQAVYSDLILGTEQYEAAFKKIVGMNEDFEKSYVRLGKVGDEAFKKIEAAATKNNPTLNQLQDRLKKLHETLGDTKIGTQKWDRIASKIRETKAEIKEHTDALKDMTEASSETEQMIGKLAGTMAKGAASFFATKMVKGALDISSEYQKLNTVLKFTTGNQASASKAMAMLADFTAKTNTKTDEATAAYVKLYNVGYKPTLAEMTKFGDLAAANEKSILQISDAIEDATAGQFEKLKQYGIVAQQNGDKVTMSFRGITKTVDATSLSLKNAILGFAEMKGVAGAMDMMNDTLEGQQQGLITNLEKLQKAAGRVVGDDLYKIATETTKGLKELLAWIIEFTNKNPVLFRTIVQLTYGIAGLVAIVAGASGLIAAAKMAIPVMGAMGISMNLALGPVGLLTGAVMALAGAFLYMKNKAEEARQASAQTAADSVDLKNAEKVIQILQMIQLEAFKSSNLVTHEVAATLKKSLKEAGMAAKDAEKYFNKNSGRQGYTRINTLGIDRVIEEIRKKQNAEEEADRTTGKFNNGLKKQIITIEDLDRAIYALSTAYKQPLHFEADFGSIGEAHAAKKALEELGATVEEVVQSGKTHDIKLKITLPPGKTLSDDLKKLLERAGFSIVTLDLKPKFEQFSAGTFEPLTKQIDAVSKKISQDSKGIFESEFAQGIKATLSMLGEMANQAVALIQAKSTLAAAKSRRTAAAADFYLQVTQKQDEKELALLNERIQDELDALDAKHEAILAEQEEFERRRKAIEDKYRDEKNLAEDEDYLREVAALEERYNQKIARLEQQYGDTEQFEIEELNLLKELEEAKLALAAQFQNAWKDEKETALNEVDAEERAAADDWKEREVGIEAEKQKLENQRSDREKQLAKEKEEREKRMAVVKWQAEMVAWAAAKQANLAAIRMQMAMGVMNAIAAGVQMAAFGGPVGWVMGPALAATLSAMVLATGSMSMAAVAAEPPPLPPVFEKGGLFTGSGMVFGNRHRDGGVNANLERGEYVMNRAATARNLPELAAMNEGRDRINKDHLQFQMTFNNYFYEKDNYDDFKERMYDDMRFGVMSAIPR